MEFIRNLTQLRPRHHGCVATIGNFDGVHRGHQTLLEHLKIIAQERHLPATVIIFEPQPQEFFTALAPARLTRLRDKLLAMSYYSVARVLCLRFTAEFANWTAADFIQRVLVKGLGVQHLVIGDDFHFGHRRQGNFATLRQAGEDYGFTVEKWTTFLLDGERVSSTRIRQALTQGNLQQAQELLGRPYTLSGRVTYGQQRGRSIGFPTANIHLHRQVSPLAGVFAILLHGVAAQPLPGVANIGTRPTIDGRHVVLEVHLFNFAEYLYGRYVAVEFIHKLRDEKRFDSIETLTQQIQQDVIFAKKLISGVPG